MSIRVYIYIYRERERCVWGFLCVVGSRQNYLRHLWSDPGVSKRPSFVYFGTKTTQSAVPAWTCETGRKNEGRCQLEARLRSRESDIQSTWRRDRQLSLGHGAVESETGRRAVKIMARDESASLVAVSDFRKVFTIALSKVGDHSRG